jgi:hypothetical protein
MAPPAFAEPVLWLMRFDGNLDSGPLTGKTYSAEFLYEDDDPYGQGAGVTPIIHASVTFDGELIYEKAYPGGRWQTWPSPNPSS